MQLLNLSFAILIFKIAICVLPGVVGIWCIASGEDSKREFRRWICGSLFGVSNAFSYNGFARFLNITGSVLIVLSFAATSFFFYTYLF